MEIPPEFADSVALVGVLWRSLDWDRWGKKKFTIYDTVEGQIAAAAYTSSLATFVQTFCRRMDIGVPGRGAADRAQLAELLSRPTTDQGTLLRQLRSESATVLVLFRAQQDTDKATKEAGHGQPTLF